MKHKEYETKSGKPIRLWQGDCMELMDGKPENYWDLAIVDPPYGIGDFSDSGSNNNERWENRKSGKDIYGKVCWNDSIPPGEYFDSLQYHANNHIIFGFQYYTKYLWDDLKGVIVHDFEDGDFTMSQADLAITNLQKRTRIFRYLWAGFKRKGKHDFDWNRVHQCEKPVQLYRWILQEYAKDDWVILDTHGGSMSLAAACYMEGYELDIIELDEDYYSDAVERFEQHIRQKTLF